MNIGGAVVIFVIVWWCVFFAVLPFGVQSRLEAGENDVHGADPGAPVKPDLKRKVLITSGIAFGVWVIVVAIVSSGIINFRN